MTTTENTRDQLTSYLRKLDTEDLQGLISRLSAAHWMPNTLIYSRRDAEKLRQRADEIELRATRDLADELLQDWSPDEIESAK